MPDFSEINPHLSLWQSETAESPGEREWLRWCAKVEKLLGHDLDGDERTQGFSMDEAHDYFEGSTTPEDYTAEVQARDNYRLQCFQSVTHRDTGRGVCAHCGKVLA